MEVKGGEGEGDPLAMLGRILSKHILIQNAEYMPPKCIL